MLLDISNQSTVGRYVTDMKLEMHGPERIVVSSLAILITWPFMCVNALVRH